MWQIQKAIDLKAKLKEYIILAFNEGLVFHEIVFSRMRINGFYIFLQTFICLNCKLKYLEYVIKDCDNLIPMTKCLL